MIRIPQSYRYPIAVFASTVDGTAKAPGDYLGFANRRVVIAAGQLEGGIVLELTGRASAELTFKVTLTAASAGTIAQGLTEVIIHPGAPPG